MKLRILSIALGTGLLAGCATMEKLGAHMEKVGAEARAKTQAEQRREDNSAGMELIGNDVDRALQVAEAIMRENGYVTTPATYKRGPGRAGSVGGTRTSNRDLGSTVGVNVVGNMLGADRSKIVKRREDTTIVWIWQKWNADFTGPEPGRLIFSNAGGSHDVTQGNEKVNAKPLSTGDILFLRDAIQGRLK